MNKYVKDLNYIICRTHEVFDRYSLSTKDIPAKNKFCVIDIDKLRIVESFMTRRHCMEYLTILINRVVTHRKIQDEMMH